MTDPKAPCACACCDRVDAGRRQMLGSAVALAAGGALAVAGVANAQAPATAAGAKRGKDPKPGDKLAHMVGPRQGKEVLPADLKAGDAPLLAYPMDAATGEVLISRAGLLTVVRMEAAALKPGSAKNAADGVVAFSSLCTHAGCPVTALSPDKSKIVCNCHGSVFDACNRGTVTTGPATRRLAMLPLALKDGAIVVAGAFDGPLGPPT